MILTTNNKDKLREIKQILGENIKGLKESGIDVDVVEDQDTFYGNALKKAKEIYEIAKEPVIADDSGLCIMALDDFPGVMTHRFLGDDATEEDRNIDLIKRLEGISDRRAKMVCNLVYYDGINTLVGEGILNGTITYEQRGDNGFGFDKILEVNGKTLGELSPEEKNKCSARYLAAVDLKNKLDNLL